MRRAGDAVPPPASISIAFDFSFWPFLRNLQKPHHQLQHWPQPIGQKICPLGVKPALTAKRHQNDTELEENRIEVVQKRAEKGITIHLTCITSGFKRNTTNVLFFNLSFPPTIIVMGCSTKADYKLAVSLVISRTLAILCKKSYFCSRGKEFYASGSGSTLFLLYFYLYLLWLVSCVEAQFCFLFVEERQKEFVSFWRLNQLLLLDHRDTWSCALCHWGMEDWMRFLLLYKHFSFRNKLVASMKQPRSWKRRKIFSPNSH